MVHDDPKMKPDGLELKVFINDLHQKGLQNASIVKSLMDSSWLLPDLMAGARKNKAVFIVRKGLQSVVGETLKRPNGDNRQSDLFGIDDNLMASAVEVGDTKFTVPNGVKGFDTVPINRFGQSKKGAKQAWKAYEYLKLKAEETSKKAERLKLHYQQILAERGWNHSDVINE